MRELFQGEPPIQYKEGVEVYSISVITPANGPLRMSSFWRPSHERSTWILWSSQYRGLHARKQSPLSEDRSWQLKTPSFWFTSYQTIFWQQVEWIVLDWKPSWTKLKLVLTSSTQYSGNNMGRDSKLDPQVEQGRHRTFLQLQISGRKRSHLKRLNGNQTSAITKVIRAESTIHQGMLK